MMIIIKNWYLTDTSISTPQLKQQNRQKLISNWFSFFIWLRQMENVNENTYSLPYTFLRAWRRHSTTHGPPRSLNEASGSGYRESQLGSALQFLRPPAQKGLHTVSPCGSKISGQLSHWINRMKMIKVPFDFEREKKSMKDNEWLHSVRIRTVKLSSLVRIHFVFICRNEFCAFTLTYFLVDFLRVLRIVECYHTDLLDSPHAEGEADTEPHQSPT